MNEQNLRQFLATARQYFFGLVPADSAIASITSCQVR